MKRFNFRLQRVLDVKSTIEEVKRGDFLTAYNKYKNQVALLQKYLNTLGKYQNELFEVEKSGPDIRYINLFYRFFQSLSYQISYQQRMVELAKEEMEKRRSILVEAVKERKILEQLKQKRFDQYLFEVGKEEQFNIDEISGGKFFQRKNKQLPFSGIELQGNV